MTPAEFDDLKNNARKFADQHNDQLKKIVTEFRDMHMQFMQTAALSLSAKHQTLPAPLMLALILKDAIFANLEGMYSVSKIPDHIAEAVMEKVDKLIINSLRPPGNN